MGPEGGDPAVAVTDEGLGVDRELPVSPLLVRRGNPVLQRIRRPGCGFVPVVRRSGHDLELVDRGGSLAVGGAQAVRSGVAAPDDDDALAGGGDGRSGEVPLLHAVGPGQVLHRLMDASELAAGIGQVARSVAPPASTTASNSDRRRSASMSTPTSTEVRNLVPSASIWARRRSRWRFSILNSGIP
jgi:hypothetical protein